MKYSFLLQWSCLCLLLACQGSGNTGGGTKNNASGSPNQDSSSSEGSKAGGGSSGNTPLTGKNFAELLQAFQQANNNAKKVAEVATAIMEEIKATKVEDAKYQGVSKMYQAIYACNGSLVGALEKIDRAAWHGFSQGVIEIKIFLEGCQGEGAVYTKDIFTRIAGNIGLEVKGQAVGEVKTWTNHLDTIFGQEAIKGAFVNKEAGQRPKGWLGTKDKPFASYLNDLKRLVAMRDQLDDGSFKQQVAALKDLPKMIEKAEKAFDAAVEKKVKEADKKFKAHMVKKWNEKVKKNINTKTFDGLLTVLQGKDITITEVRYLHDMLFAIKGLSTSKEPLAPERYAYYTNREGNPFLKLVEAYENHAAELRKSVADDLFPEKWGTKWEKKR